MPKFSNPEFSLQEIATLIEISSSAYDPSYRSSVDGYANITSQIVLDFISEGERYLSPDGRYFETPTGFFPFLVLVPSVAAGAVFYDPTLGRIVVSFRGTDSFTDYVDYPAFTRHADAFIPLVDAVKVFALEHDVNEIVFAGHSLGGAVAEIFAERNPNHLSSLDYAALTIASPLASVDGNDDRVFNLGHENDTVYSVKFATKGSNSVSNVYVALNDYIPFIDLDFTDLSDPHNIASLYSYTFETIVSSAYYEETTRTSRVIVSLTDQPSEVAEAATGLFFDEPTLIIGRDKDIANYSTAFSWTGLTTELVSEDDFLVGGRANDTLEGRSGDDTLRGDVEESWLRPGASFQTGDDVLVGGAGRDTFLGTALELNGDTIVDLEIGDRIHITDVNISSQDIDAFQGHVRIALGANADELGQSAISIIASLPDGAYFSTSADASGRGTYIEVVPESYVIFGLDSSGVHGFGAVSADNGRTIIINESRQLIDPAKGLASIAINSSGQLLLQGNHVVSGHDGYNPFLHELHGITEYLVDYSDYSYQKTDHLFFRDWYPQSDFPSYIMLLRDALYLDGKEPSFFGSFFNVRAHPLPSDIFEFAHSSVIISESEPNMAGYLQYYLSSSELGGTYNGMIQNVANYGSDQIAAIVNYIDRATLSWAQPDDEESTGFQEIRTLSLDDQSFGEILFRIPEGTYLQAISYSRDGVLFAIGSIEADRGSNGYSRTDRVFILSDDTNELIELGRLSEVNNAQISTGFNRLGTLKDFEINGTAEMVLQLFTNDQADEDASEPIDEEISPDPFPYDSDEPVDGNEHNDGFVEPPEEESSSDPVPSDRDVPVGGNEHNDGVVEPLEEESSSGPDPRDRGEPAGGGDDGHMWRGLMGGDLWFGGRLSELARGRGGDDMLVGRGGHDTLVGGGGGDTLKGGGGSDLAKGGGGSDRLLGGGSGDVLKGGGGADFMKGGAGNDRLEGQRGDDILIGQGGRDVFVFAPGFGSDEIRRFQQNVDRIEILRGADSFAALEISQLGRDVQIAFSNVEITIKGARVGQFDSDDFIF